MWRHAAPVRAWRVCQQIFAEPWEAFQQAHARYQPPSYAGRVAQRLACGQPAQIGDSEYRCLACGQGPHVVALRCTSSLCLRCAQVYVDNWVSQVRHVLHEGGIDRHILLTVPARFRTTFSQHAAVVLRAFLRCGAQGVDAFYRTGTGPPRHGGSLTVLHTHGRHGPYHPPLHVLAPSGGYNAHADRWEPLDSLPYALLRRPWQGHGLTMLRQTLKTEA